MSDAPRYSTRLVRAAAANEDATLYVATISFQSRKEPLSRALYYSKPPPDLDNVQPEDIPEGSEKAMVDSNRSGSLQPFKPEDEPFDWRPAGLIFSDTPSETRTRGVFSIGGASIGRLHPGDKYGGVGVHVR